MFVVLSGASPSLARTFVECIRPLRDSSRRRRSPVHTVCCADGDPMMDEDGEVPGAGCIQGSGVLDIGFLTRKELTLVRSGPPGCQLRAVAS